MSKRCLKWPRVISKTLWLLTLLTALHQLSVANGFYFDNGPFAAPLEKEVKGVVKDATGSPVAGVTVTIKGTKKAKTTGLDGSFSITANEGDVLIFSGVGYETRQLTVTGESFYPVALASSSTILNDVVVVGYGKSSRKGLSSAITTVKPEELNRGAITDVGQLLQGKVPGLNITASGDPNRPAAVIVRGASTINSPGGPFYVIDGIPGADIAMIAPADIASIDILKDAAATAIYGNRASNGVFIVTTRRGKKGQFQVAYSGYVGTEKVSSQLKMMDASQLRSFLSANGMGFTPADDKSANTNWQKAVERTSAVSNGHNLFVSGGSEHGSYSGSLTYMNKQGILLNSNLSRVIARLSVEQYALDDKVKFGFNVTNASSNADDIPYRNTVLLQSNLYLPVSPIKNTDGTYFENLTKSGYYNPVAMMNNSQMNTKTNNLMGNFTTQVKLPFGLSYDLNLAYMNTTTLSGYYLSSYFTSKYNGMYDNPDPTTYGHGVQAFGSNGQANRASYQNSSKIVETYFTWDKSFGKHSVNAVVGYSWQENVNGDGFQATTYNFPVDNIGYRNFALSNPYAYSTQIYFGGDLVYQKARLISDFGRVKYNYDEKYYLQGSLRRDGSSVFGANHHWGYFPAISGAWRISQEDFMRDQNVFNELKLRASYGVTGNAFGFGAYTAQFLMGSLGNYYYNGVLTSAYGPLAAANPDLKWEEIATTNIGVDFAMLKGKLNASLDFYKKKTTGMIYKYAADPILIPIGGSITANGGSIENKGVELIVTANVVSKRDFSWTSTLNLAHNDNKVLSLSNPLFSGGDSVGVGYPEGGAGLSGTSLQLLKAGKPLGQFFTPVYAGKNANGKSQWMKASGKADTVLPAVGKDYQYAGSAQPKLLLGFSNTFKYKNLDLNVFIRGVFGNKIFNATKAALFTPSTAQYTNLPVAAAGESAKDVYDYVYSTRFIESGSYVRLDNATLGYNFKNAGKYIKTLRVYGTVNNLFVITNFTGVDPEVNQGGIAPGIDYNNFYPRTRTFLLGANVSF